MRSAKKAVNAGKCSRFKQLAVRKGALSPLSKPPRRPRNAKGAKLTKISPRFTRITRIRRNKCAAEAGSRVNASVRKARLRLLIGDWQLAIGNWQFQSWSTNFFRSGLLTAAAARVRTCSPLPIRRALHVKELGFCTAPLVPRHSVAPQS